MPPLSFDAQPTAEPRQQAPTSNRKNKRHQHKMENIPSIVSQVCSGLTQAGGLIPQPVECALLAVGAFKAAEHVWSFIGGKHQVFIKRVNSTGQSTTLFGDTPTTSYFIND